VQFPQGAVVTTILDLTGGGTLSYNINGEKEITVFENMKSKLQTKSSNGDMKLAGFIPAASLWSPNKKIRFLGFDQ